MTNAFEISTGLTKAQCEAELAKKSEYTAINSNVFINICGDNDDRWAAAMKYCKEKGWHLPTQQQLASMANALYTGMQASKDDDLHAYVYGTYNPPIGSNEYLPESSSLNSSFLFCLGGGDFEEDSSTVVFYRSFFSDKTFRGFDPRYESFSWICVAD